MAHLRLDLTKRQSRLLVLGVASLPAVAVLLIACMILAEKFGEGGEASGFRNIKASAYNVFIIGLAAVVTVPLWKYLAAKFPVPGVSHWVAAA